MNAELPPRRGRFSWPLAFTLIVLIAAVLCALIFWRVESWPMRTAQQSSAELERLGRKARDAFVEIARMQPRVTINNRVYLEQTTSVAELALVSRRTEVEHEFEHTWAGSTKRVKLHGTYNVKAGFDLRQNISVNVQPNEITIQLPHAVILGVEQEEVDVLEFQNGLWNRISAEDVQNELAQLPKLAREKVAQANLTGEAEAALQKQLEQRLGSSRPIHLAFGESGPVAKD
ncbi:MAG: DUF4230 domain-containing protein [Verrucomicrobiota bacterium]|nr:DUF4230 domain-containing protein [Verrucomicrobiota bacterium]